MKKIAIALMLVLLLLVSCGSTELISLSDGQEIMEKMESDESFVFAIGTSTCPACTQYKPVLEELIESKDVEVFYIESDKVDQAVVLELVEKYLDNELEWTPTTYFIVDGEVTEALPGALRYTELVAKFEEYGFIQ
ncbi:MAG: thioredoxin family protein [Erysipelothrix sp.]|nr:thioredoxin family protein [Erysipelothrix sp.]